MELARRRALGLVAAALAVLAALLLALAVAPGRALADDPEPVELTVGETVVVEPPSEFDRGNYAVGGDGNIDSVLTCKMDSSWKITLEAVGAGAGNVSYSYTLGDAIVEARSFPVIVKTKIDISATEGGTASADMEQAGQGETVTITATPDKGWEFVEWADVVGIDTPTEASATFTIAEGDGNVSATATFKKIPYKVTAESDGHGTAEVDLAEATEGDTVTLTAKPDEGYEFDKWVTEPEGLKIENDKFAMPANAVTVTATFKKKPAPKTATLSFDLAGGTLDGKTGKVTVEAKVGDTVKLPAAPTRDGYTFKCWKGSEYAAGAEYKVEGDHEFTAEWEKLEPAYRVASGEGSAYKEGSSAPMVFTFERSVNPETAFAHFTGIEVDGKALPQKDASGKANWTARSGSVIVELQPSYLATLPAGAHTIAALFDDGDPAVADFKVSPAPAPATHTVTFDANGHGKAPDAQTVEHGKKAKRPANPTASGYTFGGWYKDEACKEAYDFSAPVTEDVTLYAKWTKKSSSGTSPKTGDPLAGAFAIALALAAASALALAFSRRMRRG